jgi:ribosome biogenesis GTPase
MKGRIIKGIAGFYYVATEEEGIFVCRARGVFRKDKKKPLVGDQVEIEVTHEQDKEASIIRIFPRKNELIRPAVANVDQAMILFALKNPDPDPMLLDRFLVMMEMQGIPAFIVLNKMDLTGEEEIREWQRIYQSCGYDLLITGLEQGIGAEAIRQRLEGKVTVAAGPSGVGKSTLTNLFQNQIRMETGQISKKLGRGRHTTRHSELIPLNRNTFLCDTPGFTSLMLPEMERQDLERYFPEMREHTGNCRFTGCAHVNEPDCAVKEAVEAGKISRERYAHYVDLYQELTEREKRRY